MNFKKFLILFFLVANIIFALEISPLMYEQRIDADGGYREFVIKNSGDKTLRYKVSIYPGISHRDMSKWMEVSPKILNIKPGTEGVLKVYAKAPNSIEPGEYSFTLSLKMVDLPKLPGDIKTVDPVAKINFDFRLEYLGYAGNLSPDIKLINPKLKENSDGTVNFSTKLKNNTEKRGVFYGVEIIGRQGLIHRIENRLSKKSETDISVNLDKLIKKSDITGVILRNYEDNKELQSLKLN